MAVRWGRWRKAKETGSPREGGHPWHDERLRAYAQAARRRLHEGELGPAPALLALAVTWIVFQSLNENFLSPRNLSVLSVEIVGTGMVAVGVVFVLLIGEIDLSVGSLAGLSGAMFAALNVNHGMPEGLAVFIAVLCGAAAGAAHGFIFTKIGVPAFVVTLSGLLAWNGLMLYLLGPESSISFSDDGLVAELTSRYFSAPSSPTAWPRSGRPRTSSCAGATAGVAQPPGCRTGRGARSGCVRHSSRWSRSPRSMCWTGSRACRWRC